MAGREFPAYVPATRLLLAISQMGQTMASVIPAHERRFILSTAQIDNFEKSGLRVSPRRLFANFVSKVY